MRAPAIAILMALTGLGFGQIFAAGGAFNDERTINLQHSDWMSWVPDDVPLGVLSIPGTHDTMADCKNGCFMGPDDLPYVEHTVPLDINLVDLTKITQTQSLSLIEQLEAGVRFLDIRLWP